MCLIRLPFSKEVELLEGIAQGLCHLVPSTFSIVLQNGLHGIDEIDETSVLNRQVPHEGIDSFVIVVLLVLH